MEEITGSHISRRLAMSRKAQNTYPRSLGQRHSSTLLGRNPVAEFEVIKPGSRVLLLQGYLSRLSRYGLSCVLSRLVTLDGIGPMVELPESSGPSYSGKYSSSPRLPAGCPATG